MPLGDLSCQLLSDSGQARELIAKQILKQLVVALEGLHARRILHGDIKPSNILIGLTGKDF